MIISAGILNFFRKHTIALVSTYSANGDIHCSVKGLGDIEPDGSVYIVDVHLNTTYKNLKWNPTVAISAFNESTFEGYSLQGRAEILKRDDVPPKILVKWNKQVARRITQRIIGSLQAGVKSHRHHEAELPDLKYIIKIDVEKCIDLSPPSLRKLTKG